MEDCLFCKIAAGDIPSKKLYEDEQVVAFYDIAPQAKVHFLVIPKKHIPSAAALTEEDGALLGHVFAVIAKLAKEQGLDNGYRVISNVGEDAGEGIVQIKSVSREAGSRTKIAVQSIDEKIDPIGACVGPKGSRVKAVVDELGGEKIDIINYSEDPAEFISAALSPSKVEKVEINEEEKTALVVVPDYQLSLAIGKSGQNARLAAKLTNWKIDIKSVSQMQAEMEAIKNVQDVDFVEEDIELQAQDADMDSENIDLDAE